MLKLVFLKSLLILGFYHPNIKIFKREKTKWGHLTQIVKFKTAQMVAVTTMGLVQAHTKVVLTQTTTLASTIMNPRFGSLALS